MSKKQDAIRELMAARFCVTRFGESKATTPEGKLMDCAYERINNALQLLGHKEASDGE